MIGKYLDLHFIPEIFSYSHHFYFDFSNPILPNAFLIKILDKVLLRFVQN